MKKAELLREALIAANTWCKANPELITVWVEKGSIETQATGEPSFMYRYTIQVLAVDFPGQVDDLMLPIMEWVWHYQPDLLLNPDNNRKVEFDADIISDDMSNDAALFQQLDQVFAEILSAMTPARRLRTARGIATTLRRTQSQRIGKQVAPDGTPYQKRHRRVLRSQAGIGFIWQGEERRLRNWRATRGSRGRMLTGFDEGRGAVRSFYRADIERYLDISFNETRRDTTKADPMFRRLRTARFLKARATSEGASVGFTGVAARIARVHQYGLRDRVNDSGAMASYPRRELLGLSKTDRMMIARQVIDSLGVR